MPGGRGAGGLGCPVGSDCQERGGLWPDVLLCSDRGEVMAPTSSLTQRERDNLHEQTVEALLEHEAESSKRQSDLTSRLDRIEATQQRIGSA